MKRLFFNDRIFNYRQSTNIQGLLNIQTLFLQVALSSFLNQIPFYSRHYILNALTCFIGQNFLRKGVSGDD